MIVVLVKGPMHRERAEAALAFISDWMKVKNADRALELCDVLDGAIYGYKARKQLRPNDIDKGKPDPKKLRDVIQKGEDFIRAMHAVPELYDHPQILSPKSDLPHAPDSTSIEAQIRTQMQRAEIELPANMKRTRGRQTGYEHYYFVTLLLQLYSDLTGEDPAIYTHEDTDKPPALRFIESAYSLVDDAPPSPSQLKKLLKRAKKQAI